MNEPRPKLNQRAWWIIGGIGVLLMGAFAVWFGISASSGVTYNQAGFKIMGDDRIDVRFDVGTPEKKPVTCTLIAMNDKRDVVGTKVVQLQASRYDSTRYSAQVRTTSRAVTGTVRECHYTADHPPAP